MALIYVSEDTKALIDEVAERDTRSRDGEIAHLAKNRIAELNVELIEKKLEREQNEKND